MEKERLYAEKEHELKMKSLELDIEMKKKNNCKSCKRNLRNSFFFTIKLLFYISYLLLMSNKFIFHKNAVFG